MTVTNVKISDILMVLETMKELGIEYIDVQALDTEDKPNTLVIREAAKIIHDKTDNNSLTDDKLNQLI